jgi:hypothetical protein
LVCFIARLGTTRRQVWTHFVEVEQPALQPLAPEGLPFFTSGERTVHTDGHVEVGSAFCPVPLVLLRQKVRVRWDAQLVRVFHGDTLVAVHARVADGVFAPRAGEAEVALAARGVGAIRLIQGVLGLTRKNPRERVLAAVTEAHAHQHFRYQTIRQLVERTPARPRPALRTNDPAIRPMT